MEILSDSEKDIKKAADAISRGLLVAFPTETVYGLGADVFNQEALARVFEAKNRPRFDPLIVHIADQSFINKIGDLSLLSSEAKANLSILIKELWPGPLTLILPKRKEVPALATAGLENVAVRFPLSKTAQKLIQLSKTGAIAAPSANPFGKLSPTRAEHVIEGLGEKVDFIIDGGKTSVGIESTVLDLTSSPITILRHGGTSREAIEALIGQVEVNSSPSPDTEEKTQALISQALLSPGQLKSHYAPSALLYLYKPGELALIPDNPNEGRLYFSGDKESGDRDSSSRIKVLSKSGKLTEAAANLFDKLHELDSLGLKIIRAEEAPYSGLGEAINDRLRRAAAR